MDANKLLQSCFLAVAAGVAMVVVLCGGCLMLTQPITPEAKRAAEREASRLDRQKLSTESVLAVPSTPAPAAPAGPTNEEARAEYLRSLGLDPSVSYPYFPLVYWGVESDRGRFGTTVTGYVKNCSDQRFRYVQITFALYDSWGNKVGNAYDNLSGLDAWETWRFKAIGLGDNGQKYRLEDLEGF